MADYMKEQEKPLAPGSDLIDVEEDKPSPRVEHTSGHHGKCIICCGCCAAIILILVMLVLILIFTVFRVKEPVLKMNSITVHGPILHEDSRFRPGVNLSIEADFSVKNPNYASFKFDNATTSVYYDTFIIGEFVNPAGRVRARKIYRTNITIDIMVEKVLDVPRFRSDLVAKILPVNTFTRIRGKVKVTSVFKKRVFVKMKCTMMWNISSLAIQDRDCKSRLKF